METPQHTHDCDTCLFLGRCQNLDLYVCVGILDHTVIARYGSDGPQYTSAPVCMLERMHDPQYSTAAGSRAARVLTLAAVRAAERGHLPPVPPDLFAALVWETERL